MRETRFIEQNQEKWTEFEGLLEKKKKNPDKLSKLFIQITDDLSFARTNYPNRSVRVYLNGLAQQLFYSIYKNRKAKWSVFKEFWTLRLPSVVYQTRKQFLLAFLIFWLSFGIGVFSGFMEPDFLSSILGERYVAMTEANIEGGDPMAVYKEMNEVDMFLGITLNNLRVDFLAFLLGLFFGIGTIGILIFNGIMIGAFQYFFIERGLFWESFLTIWTHGTLEVSAIIISAAAGIVLGRGLAFPGTLSRLQAFQLSARQGIRILLGVLPLTVVAGFLEGFLTRYTDTPDAIRLILILLCLVFVILYFVVLPGRLARAGLVKQNLEDRLPPDRDSAIDYQKVKSAGEVFLDTFTVFRRHLSLILKSSALLSAVAVICYFTIVNEDYQSTFELRRGVAFNKVEALFNYSEFPVVALINALALSLGFCVIGYILTASKRASQNGEEDSASWKKVAKFTGSKFVPVFAIIAIASSFFFMEGFVPALLAVLLFPFFGMWIFSYANGGKSFLASLGQSQRSIWTSFTQVLLIAIILSVMGFLAYLLVESPLTWLYFEIVSWGFDFDLGTMRLIVLATGAFLNLMVTILLLYLYLIALSFIFFSSREILTAASIRDKIDSIGDRKKAFGMEQESS